MQSSKAPLALKKQDRHMREVRLSEKEAKGESGGDPVSVVEAKNRFLQRIRIKDGLSQSVLNELPLADQLCVVRRERSSQ